jgi:hypothetical protein
MPFNKVVDENFGKRSGKKQDYANENLNSEISPCYDALATSVLLA